MGRQRAAVVREMQDKGWNIKKEEQMRNKPKNIEPRFKDDHAVRAMTARTGMLRAHLLVDAQLNVIWDDVDAEMLLDGLASELCIADGRLRANCPQWQDDLKQLIGSSSANGPRLRAATSPLGTLRVEVRPLQRRRHPVDSASVRLLVVQAVTSHTHLGEVASYYGLSPSETRVIDVICTHGRLGDYADHVDVSIHTARKQMKNALAKLGVHSQVEAVRLIFQTYLDWRVAA